MVGVVEGGGVKAAGDEQAIEIPLYKPYVQRERGQFFECQNCEGLYNPDSRSKQSRHRRTAVGRVLLPRFLVVRALDSWLLDCPEKLRLYMNRRELKTWLTDRFKEAEPLDRPSEMINPQDVAIKATKKLGLLGLCSRELFSQGSQVETPQQCAAVLSGCLAALNQTDIRPQSLPIDPELLTVREAAQQYNLGQRTLYRLVERGELPHHRIGTAIRIKPTDLLSYLEDQAQPQAVQESLFD